jgi:oxalate decarboxylase/phosphoglucose isomerase-like protein (cupin superfamily)
MAQLCDGTEGFRYIATLELRSGAIRGNHYHKTKEEWLFVLAGCVSLTLKEITAGSSEKILLNAGDLTFIPPLVAHAFEVQNEGHAIEFAKQRFDPADIFKFLLISPPLERS